VCSSRGCQADTGLIAVRKFNTSRLECLLEQHKRGLPCSLCFALEQPNSGYPDMRDICEALLGPVEEASRRPALGSCNHGLGRTKTSESRQFDCFSIDRHLLI
jgi:hypothetical protein